MFSYVLKTKNRSIVGYVLKKNKTILLVQKANIEGTLYRKEHVITTLFEEHGRKKKHMMHKCVQHNKLGMRQDICI